MMLMTPLHQGRALKGLRFGPGKRDEPVTMMVCVTGSLDDGCLDKMVGCRLR
jgi:hypothetical protein